MERTHRNAELNKSNVGEKVVLLDGLHHGFLGLLVQRPAQGAVAYHLEAQAFQGIGVPLHAHVSVCHAIESGALLGKGVSVVESYPAALYFVQQGDAALGLGAKAAEQ